MYYFSTYVAIYKQIKLKLNIYFPNFYLASSQCLDMTQEPIRSPTVHSSDDISNQQKSQNTQELLHLAHLLTTPGNEICFHVLFYIIVLCYISIC